MPESFLELFAGIGGFSAALHSAQTDLLKYSSSSDQPNNVAVAVDIDRCALATYASNFANQICAAEICSLDLRPFANFGWWMSPPCLPYTRRGNQQGLSDPRSESYKYLIAQIAKLTPPIVALENVPPFAQSDAFQLWTSTLMSAGYQLHSRMACPTQLGIPMRRNRFYALAIHREVSSSGFASRLEESFNRTWQPPRQIPLAHYLSGTDEVLNLEELMLETEIQNRYRTALDVVSPSDPQSICACFTSSYGKSIVRSGSYLQVKGRLRRFSPREIARLLGFPDTFVLPENLRTAYRLLGNSLSVDVVSRLLFSSRPHESPPASLSGL